MRVVWREGASAYGEPAVLQRVPGLGTSDQPRRVGRAGRGRLSPCAHGDRHRSIHRENPAVTGRRFARCPPLWRLKMKHDSSAEWRPVAHVTVQDTACREAIIDTLHRRGWSVVEQPTGLHLIHAISGHILGDQPWLRPELIVTDAAARGCTARSARTARSIGPTIRRVLRSRRDRRRCHTEPHGRRVAAGSRVEMRDRSWQQTSDLDPTVRKQTEAHGNRTWVRHPSRRALALVSPSQVPMRSG